MKFIVLAEDEDWKNIQTTAVNCTFVRAQTFTHFISDTTADAYFNLQQQQGKQNYDSLKAPVFINDTTNTLAENNYPQNILRLQAWPGFIQKNVWEIAGTISAKVVLILNSLQKKHVHVADNIGFVTTNTIAMIINEAYFALGENVSTKADIDIAMKLGTNYPYGPFEWASLIGLTNIADLLKKLALQNTKYSPAPLLLQQCK